MIGLRLTVFGVAKVQWTEKGGRSSSSYQGEQDFLKAVIYLFGKEGGETIEISSGIHFYKFSCRIPNNAPSSAEGMCGYISYCAEAKLDIPYMRDMTSRQPFSVVRQEDLRRYPELQIPCEIEEVKTFCCCICESDPLMLKLSTKHSGYTLGEIVCVRVEIFNRSNMRFNKSLITLNRVETFNSYAPLEKSKKNIIAVSATFSKGVEPNRNASFEENLQIPYNVSTSNDRISFVFQIAYEIKVFLKAYKKSSTIEASVPIYIGNVGFGLGSKASVDSTSLPTDDSRKILLSII